MVLFDILYTVRLYVVALHLLLITPRFTARVLALHARGAEVAVVMGVAVGVCAGVANGVSRGSSCGVESSLASCAES